MGLFNTEQKNIIQEKEAQLGSLMSQSNSAVNLITDTIQRLENVNNEIAAKKQEIASYLTQLGVLNDSMTEQFIHNEKIIGKFKSFLED